MISQRFSYYIVSLDTAMDGEDSDSHLACIDDSPLETVEKVPPAETPTSPFACPFQNSSEDYWQWNPSARGEHCQLQDDLTVIFHPTWSNSTQAVRGTRLLDKEMVYWEVFFPERVFGTAMMVGVGTPDARLSSSNFEPLLGSDANSWGLCHKGFIYHNKERKRYCAPFQENVATTVGVLFDGRNGSVTFYKDNRSLGIAFRGLEECRKELYPMASSTAAKTVMRLQNMRRCRAGMTLQEMCRDVILKQIGEPADVLDLPLPYPIKAFVFQHAWKTGKRKRSCFARD